MTVLDLYRALSARYPRELSCEWDNDGKMCVPAPSAEVTGVLCTLDVTEETVDVATALSANVILSHHPLLFHPVASLTPETPEGRILLAAVRAGIAILSFHTRADAAEGGVNDLLCARLGIRNTAPFADGIGRIGDYPTTTAEEFAHTVAERLGAPLCTLGDAGRPVSRVAVLGGSGKNEVDAAIAAGADTFLSGRLSYESVNMASSLGINLLEAGHFYTEALLPRHWADELLPALGVRAIYYHSCSVKVIG